MGTYQSGWALAYLALMLSGRRRSSADKTESMAASSVIWLGWTPMATASPCTARPSPLRS
jgi:hypothetical protein